MQLGQLSFKAKHVYVPAPAIPRHYLREMCMCVHQKTREGTLMAALFIAVLTKTTRMPTASRTVSASPLLTQWGTRQTYELL